MISIPGLIAFAAVAIPEISPPPPIGTTSMSRSGASASSSSAIVPCPAIMAGSSNGGMKTKPSLSASAKALAWASSNIAPSNTTCAPWPSVWVTFIDGVEVGMTMVTGMPRRLP